MPPSNAIIYTTASLAIGTTIFWIWVKVKRIQTRRRFCARNLQYVDFPGMFTLKFTGKHTEQEEYDRVKRYGKVFATKMFGMETIFVAEPELAQLVLSKEFTSFTNRRNFNFNDPILNAFMSLAVDEQWKRLRSIVTPTFSTGKLKRMKPRIDDTIETMMKNVENAVNESPIVNVKQFYGAFTMDTIMQVAFGTKVDSLAEKNNPIVEMAKKLFSNDINIRGILGFALLMLAPRLAKLIGVRNDVFEFFQDFSLKIIREKREEFKKNGDNVGKANNFLELLLEAEAENEKLEKEIRDGSAESKAVKFMTNDEMIAQCILFFIAAYDTTNTTISLASYFLATHPEIQDRLYTEINTVIEKLRQESPVQLYNPLKLVTFESLSQFEYLNAVISETLRYFPPASVERTASRDTTLQTEDGAISVQIKKGDVIHFPVYAMHRDVDQFPEPEVFNPDRFMGVPTFHKYAYLPFGSGPRNCVARSLALFEAKMALLSVVYRYKLSTCEQTKIPVEFYNNGQILTPKDVILKLEKR